jgi:8-oxo-dGTP pyrophosphatase MutT (NUDIX family)
VVLFRRKGAGYEVCIGKQVKGKPSNGQWVLPGGHVHDEEDPMDAAKRELKEETGAVASLSFCEKNGDDAIFFGVVAEGTGAEASSDLLSLTWVPSEKIPEMAWDQKDAVLRCLKKLTKA